MSTTPWDDVLKQLIHVNPQAFLDWVVPGAKFVHERSYDLHSEKREVDSLLEAVLNEHAMLVDIEFQTNNDYLMAERLLIYNVLARSQHQLPVLSCVIYLFTDGNVPEPPLVWIIPNGEEVLRFQYLSIELAKLSPEDILGSGLKGLYPLIPFTKGGERREEVERMFRELGGTGTTQLELCGFTISSLVFRRRKAIDDENWLTRRFQQMQSILKEAPIYQMILQEGREEGLEKGEKMGFEKGRLQASRDMLLKFVQLRFPKLKTLARGQAALIEKPEILEDLTLKVGMAQTQAEVQNYLIEWEETYKDLLSESA
jgi:predicted transposase YdaD